jgi:predicted patatin/cPLA2 family phospholipase
MNQVGLVLEGGGMRGLYTCGVLDFFMEQNLYFPYIIGVSAGACNALSYVTKQKGRSRDININCVNDERYISYKNLFKHGELFGMDFMFGEVTHTLYPLDMETLENSPEKLLICATDCVTGQPTYFDRNNCNDFLTAVRASCSLPFVNKVVQLQGKYLLDGGISDSIPIKKSIKDGNVKNVIILTRNKEYRKKPFKLNFLLKKMYAEYPNLIHSITNRYQMYNTTLDYIEDLEQKGNVFVIRPTHSIHVKRAEKDPQKLLELHTQGYDHAKQIYTDLLNWLKE